MKRFFNFSIPMLITAMHIAMPALAWNDPLNTQKFLPPPFSPNSPELGRSEKTICASEQNLPDYPLSALDVLDLTLCNNPQTREFWAAAQLQAAQLGQSKSNLLPSLNGTLGTNQSRSRHSANNRDSSATLNLSWVLLDFGTRSAQIARDELLLSAAIFTQNNNLQSLMQTALKYFYTAKAAQAALTSTLEAEKYAMESFNAANDRYQVGVGTPADQLQAQTAYSQSTLNRISAEGTLQVAYGNLMHVMGFAQPFAKKIKLADIPAPPVAIQLEKDVEKIIQTALEIRPDLKAQNLRVHAAQESVKAARAAGLPSLNLNTSGNWQRQTSPISNINHNGTVGLQINIPLFTGFNRHYLIKESQASLASTEAARDSLKNQVALDIWQAYQNLITAIQSLKATDDLVKSAQQSADVAMGRYKAGVGNVLDLLNAQASLADARLQKIQAQLNWHSYRIDLAKAAGNLNYQSLFLP